MHGFLRTTVAALGGATRRLAGLAALVTLLALAPHAMTSIANTGALDVSSLLPATSLEHSPARTYDVSGGTAAERESVRRALDDLVWPVDGSAMRLVIDDGSNLPANAIGMHVFPANIIYVRDAVAADPARRGLTRVLAHEIGHMIDLAYLDDAGRADFLRARGFDAGAEWRPASAPWESSPAEDFAEVFAVLDVPSSTAPIATSAGSIRDAAGMRALIQRYQSATGRRMLPLGVATALSVASEMATEGRSDKVASAWILFLAVIAAATGARNAVGPYSKRAARAAREAVHS